MSLTVSQTTGAVGFSEAETIQFDHSYTAGILTEIAESYDQDARRHDEDAERLDWET